MTAEFCAALGRVLEPGGEFLLKTDDVEYFEESMTVLAASPDLDEIAWEDGAFFYPQTDFEHRWLGRGRTIQSARFRVSV